MYASFLFLDRRRGVRQIATGVQASPERGHLLSAAGCPVWQTDNDVCGQRRGRSGGMLRKSFTYRPWCQYPSSYTCDIFMISLDFIKWNCFYIVIFTSTKYFFPIFLKKIDCNSYMFRNWQDWHFQMCTIQFLQDFKTTCSLMNTRSFNLSKTA